MYTVSFHILIVIVDADVCMLVDVVACMVVDVAVSVVGDVVDADWYWEREKLGNQVYAVCAVSAG